MDDAVRFDRLFRNVMISAIVAAAAYLAFSLWVGWRDVGMAVGRVGVAGLAVALALSLANYVLRFARWQMYLRALGSHIPNGPSALIYLAGFAFTTTPGKVGELLRGIFLHRRGTPYLQSTAAFVSERLSDLLAMVLLVLPGLWLLSRPAGAALAVATVLGLACLALAMRETVFRKLEGWVAAAPGKVGTLLGKLLSLLAEAKRCHGRGLIAATTGLSLIAWGAEAVAFALVLKLLGLDMPLATAVFIYAASMIAGALSFLPGGLGGAEATMIGLLALYGAPNAESVAATILIRFTTLWFAVALGILSSLAGRRALLTPAPTV